MNNAINILDPQNLEIHYQPIFSMRECRVMGFEALCRIKEGTIDPSIHLFQTAKNQNCTLEFDRLCRRMAINGFPSLIKDFPDAILFINIETSIVDQNVVGSGQIKDSVMDAGLQPYQVCLEINETEVKNKRALIDFCRLHKRFGFLVAIDDLGTGHSNFERLTQIQPDIIKLDKSLVQGMQHDHKKAQIIRLLCELSSNMGTLTIAEGVEYYEEMVDFYQFGGDLVQGFYLSKPLKPGEQINGKWLSALKSSVQHAKDAEMQRLERGKHRQQDFLQLIELVSKELENKTLESSEDLLALYVKGNEDCECFYIIDNMGIQLTETITRAEGLSIRNKSLYRVATEGTNHSYKDYFYIPFMSQVDLYASEPYVSKASGNRCRTYTSWFELLGVGRCLICMDVLEIN